MEIGVGLGDHVQLLVKFKPSLSIEWVVRGVKMLTTISEAMKQQLSKTLAGHKDRDSAPVRTAPQRSATPTPKQPPPTSATRPNDYQTRGTFTIGPQELDAFLCLVVAQALTGPSEPLSAPR